MLHDEIFKTALSEAGAESCEALKDEVISMERAIERFLSSVLECTSNLSARDFCVSDKV